MIYHNQQVTFRILTRITLLSTETYFFFLNQTFHTELTKIFLSLENCGPQRNTLLDTQFNSDQPSK